MTETGTGFDDLSEYDADLLEWLANGETGLSSETMAFAAMGLVKHRFGGFEGIDHPHDPDDLMRCVKLERAVPWVRDAADALLREQSGVWANLLDRWDELVATLLRECPTGRGSAPLTYKRMKELGA